MAALRQDEQRAAAAVVGVSDVRFLGHPDGRLEATIELRRDISRVIRQVRPERVLTQSPDRNWDFIFASHPDHLAAGEAAVCAVYPDARNPFAHPELLDGEGLEPWSVPELWIMGPGGGQGSGIAVDTTATVERKVAALMCHKSQMPDPESVTKRILDGARAMGELAGLPEGSSAEHFRVTRIP
jgi:LmbE family N-acetylglucosaminyl deacetylase